LIALIGEKNNNNIPRGEIIIIKKVIIISLADPGRGVARGRGPTYPTPLYNTTKRSAYTFLIPFFLRTRYFLF